MAALMEVAAQRKPNIRTNAGFLYARQSKGIRRFTRPQVGVRAAASSTPSWETNQLHAGLKRPSSPALPVTPGASLLQTCATSIAEFTVVGTSTLVLGNLFSILGAQGGVKGWGMNDDAAALESHPQLTYGGDGNDGAGSGKGSGSGGSGGGGGGSSWWHSEGSGADDYFGRTGGLIAALLTHVAEVLALAVLAFSPAIVFTALKMTETRSNTIRRNSPSASVATDTARWRQLSMVTSDQDQYLLLQHHNLLFQGASGSPLALSPASSSRRHAASWHLPSLHGILASMQRLDARRHALAQHAAPLHAAAYQSLSSETTAWHRHLNSAAAARQHPEPRMLHNVHVPWGTWGLDDSFGRASSTVSSPPMNREGSASLPHLHAAAAVFGAPSGLTRAGSGTAAAVHASSSRLQRSERSSSTVVVPAPAPSDAAYASLGPVHLHSRGSSSACLAPCPSLDAEIRLADSIYSGLTHIGQRAGSWLLSSRIIA